MINVKTLETTTNAVKADDIPAPAYQLYQDFFLTNFRLLCSSNIYVKLFKSFCIQ